MSNVYVDTFMGFLEKEQKDLAVSFAIGLLNEKKLDIETLYLKLLTPALTLFECTNQDTDICIWKEHFRTSIIRTILEISYMHILEITRNITKKKPKVVVLTPAFEYHEIGAIMNTHLFLLEGIDATYIGANTPKAEILSAIRAYHPNYVALSVTNPYNLVVTKQTTDDIKRFFPDVKIILGGQAFKDVSNLAHIQYDYLLTSQKDLKSFAKEVL